MRAHPEIIHRTDALLLDIRNALRALCRRSGAAWDGPDLPPLSDDWWNDTLTIARMKAREKRSAWDEDDCE